MSFSGSAPFSSSSAWLPGWRDADLPADDRLPVPGVPRDPLGVGRAPDWWDRVRERKKGAGKEADEGDRQRLRQCGSMIRTDSIAVLAPAKINLGLEVLGRRMDGYHEIVTVLQTVRLTDTVRLRVVDEPGIHLTVRPRGLDLGPEEENLAMRAARLIPAHSAPKGLQIQLDKRIPVGAGLGGGSSDAAAVLIGLSLLRRGGYNPEALEEAGASLGCDVPFFIRGGTQLAFGRGEKLRPAPEWPAASVVLIFPNRSLSTGSIYRQSTFKLTSSGPLSSLRSRGFTRGFWHEHGARLRNDLEPAVLEAEPAVGSVIKDLRRLGCSLARVTGSGSAVFGVAPNSTVAASWSEHFIRRGFWAKAVRPARGGCLVRTWRG